MNTTTNQSTQEMSSRGTRDLQAMMKEALSLYELARVASFQSTAKPSDDLLAAIQAAQQAADDLLQKAGVAHLLGAPLQLNQGAAHDSGDEAIVKAFAAAQLAYAEVRVSLLRLAELFTKQGRWQQAQKIAQPFLDDPQDPLHDEALNILRQTHYQPALVALQSGDLQKAQQELQQVLQLKSPSQHVLSSPNEMDLHLTRALIDAKLTDKAKELLENWLIRSPITPNLNNVLCEIHYQLALIAIEREEWEPATEHIRSIWGTHPSYRDTRKLVMDNVLLLWRLGKVQCVENHYATGNVRGINFSLEGDEIYVSSVDSNHSSGKYIYYNYLYIFSPNISESFKLPSLEHSDYLLSMRFVSESELLLFTSQFNDTTKTTLFNSFSFDTIRKTFTNPQPIAEVPKEVPKEPKEPKDSPNSELAMKWWRDSNSGFILIFDSKSRNLVNKIKVSRNSVNEHFFFPNMQAIVLFSGNEISLWAPYLV